MVERDSDDSWSTGVYQPDLGTRVQAPESPAGSSRYAPWKRQVLSLVKIPDWLQWEVQPRWTLIIIAGTVVLGLAIVSGLRMKIDHGPFPGPSVASTRNLHLAVSSLHNPR